LETYNKKIFLLVINKLYLCFHVIILAVTFKTAEFLLEAKKIKIDLFNIISTKLKLAIITLIFIKILTVLMRTMNSGKQTN